MRPSYDESNPTYALHAMSYTISDATPDDYPFFASIFKELGVPEPTPSLERFVTLIAPHAIVVRTNGEPAGYAWSRPRGDRLHVVHVIASPHHRRAGVGASLMTALAARARAMNMDRWMLNVKPENVAARGLYERFGMKVAFASTSLRLMWRDLDRLPLGPETDAFVVPTTDDETLETMFDLSTGELATSREMGRLIIGIRHRSSPCGLAIVDPTLPGASVFRTAPAHARALLVAISSHVAGDDIRVFVEGNAALEEALDAAGAVAVLRALRMEGMVPTSSPPC
jgi:ribosomal protein S18 acetylase RimI-like enzyme